MNHDLSAEEKIKRDDRVRYYVAKLKDVLSKNKLFKLIEKNGITSKSTAERVSKGVFDWTKGEIDLFLATYNPTKSDSKVIDKFLGIDTRKISNEVKEEPINDNEEFEEELKDGDTVEFAEEDKSTECDTEASHIINELSAKNQELQKELHTSKNVITTLQKGVNELNEAITESNIMIAEVAKERDDKAEEIRVLRLENERYKNNLKTIEVNRNDIYNAYEELRLELQHCKRELSHKDEEFNFNPKYDSLYKVLLSAYNQASNGKGKERHQLNDDEPFEKQKICEIARRLSVDYNLGQAVKKIYESKRLTDGRDIAELYGAINYIAAAIIVKQEEI